MAKQAQIMQKQARKASPKGQTRYIYLSILTGIYLSPERPKNSSWWYLTILSMNYIIADGRGGVVKVIAMIWLPWRVPTHQIGQVQPLKMLPTLETIMSNTRLSKSAMSTFSEIITIWRQLHNISSKAQWSHPSNKKQHWCLNIAKYTTGPRVACFHQNNCYSVMSQVG